jgi:tripeptide aminopeptidase
MLTFGAVDGHTSTMNDERPMRTALLMELLAVQTCSTREERMVEFLLAHCRAAGCEVYSDKSKNVYVTKGQADWYPAVAAHIDTVQMFDDIEIRRAGDASDRFIGFKAGTEDRRGIGADCKTGIFVCLELLDILPVLKVAFFAMEEIGCVGARKSDPSFFKNIGYLLEFDCPSKNMMSYTSSGVRLFDNDGPFINAALPVLQAYNVQWQHHPFTDVSAIRPMYNMSCMNLSSGYYNWHADTEFAYLPDVQNAITMGVELLAALGSVHYPFTGDQAAPKAPVTSLAVTHVV